MHIGIAEGKTLTFIQPSRQKGPIVVYGTSIAQGGCASRPGLAWPSILGRSLNQEVINLGFSGNGRLEAPIIKLMIRQQPSVYILDCLPNMGSATLFPDNTLVETIKNAVKQIRTKDKSAPIILSHHSGARVAQVYQIDKDLEFSRTSDLLDIAYKQLRALKIPQLYLMTSKEIGLDLESTVDGAHPNDLGMKKHAQAYEKLIKKMRQN